VGKVGDSIPPAPTEILTREVVGSSLTPPTKKTRT
jgi:hypothetical protein